MEDRSSLYILFGAAGIGVFLTGLVFAVHLAYAEEIYVSRIVAGIMNCF